MVCSLPGSSVHGVLQASILAWIAIPFSRGSPWPRDQTQVSHVAGRFFTVWAVRDILIKIILKILDIKKSTAKKKKNLLPGAGRFHGIALPSSRCRWWLNLGLRSQGFVKIISKHSQLSWGGFPLSQEACKQNLGVGPDVCEKQYSFLSQPAHQCFRTLQWLGWVGNGDFCPNWVSVSTCILVVGVRGDGKGKTQGCLPLRGRPHPEVGREKCKVGVWGRASGKPPNSEGHWEEQSWGSG